LLKVQGENYEVDSTRLTTT